MTGINFTFVLLGLKDLSRVKAGFKGVLPRLYFEFAELTSANKWRDIQNIVEEERF